VSFDQVGVVRCHADHSDRAIVHNENCYCPSYSILKVAYLVLCVTLLFDDAQTLFTRKYHMHSLRSLDSLPTHDVLCLHLSTTPSNTS
jgi:hypothetical protein